MLYCVLIMGSNHYVGLFIERNLVQHIVQAPDREKKGECNKQLILFYYCTLSYILSDNLYCIVNVIRSFKKRNDEVILVEVRDMAQK